MIRIVVAGHPPLPTPDVTRLRHAAPDLAAPDTVTTLTELRERLHHDGTHVGIVHRAPADLDTAAITRHLTGTHTHPPTYLVMTDSADHTTAARILHDGAHGFLLSDSPAEELVTAVRAVAAGYHYVPPPYIAPLADTLRHLHRHTRPGTGHTPLTDREHDVLAHLAHGMSNHAIGRRLYISEATVRTHVLNLLRKLQVRNRTEAVVHAYRRGLLDPHAPPPGPEPETDPTP